MVDWPHAPPHRLTEAGVYMVTAGTYRKAHLLFAPSRLDMFQNLLFEGMNEAGWHLHAWAVLSNHYHLIAAAPSDPGTLGTVISKLHTLSARELNRLDGQIGRKVWFQFFDSHITYTNSYLPRLKYVHHNPTHHGVTRQSEDYRWCSACWFAKTARPAFRRTVENFKTDALKVTDPFEAIPPKLDESESGVKPPHSKSISPASRLDPLAHDAGEMLPPS